MNNEIKYGIGGLLIGIILGILVAPGLGFGYGRGMMSGWGMMSGPNARNGIMGRDANIDRHFIEQMIPHHEGAIEMARIALERSKRPEIQSLANGIIEAQTKEIADMRQWYRDWFDSAPSQSSIQGMMGMHGMQGDTEQLRTATDFDQEFIRQMVVHHEMAVMMARMLQVSTERPDMKELADNIITSQTREIEMMRSWAKAWSGSQAQ